MIRNIKVLDYFFYAVPGSPRWKSIRRVKLLTFPVCAMISLVWAFVYLFLDVSAEARVNVDIGVVAYVLTTATLYLFFANIDTLFLRFSSLIAFVDVISLIIVVTLLGLYGQGHVVYGITYSIVLFAAAYSFESMEVDTRLNMVHATREHYVIRQGMFGWIVLVAIVFRVGIFLKQVSVRSDIILAELPNAAGAFRVRDLWEFFVDVVILRVIYMSVSRLRQPSDTIDIGRNYAELVPAEGNTLGDQYIVGRLAV